MGTLSGLTISIGVIVVMIIAVLVLKSILKVLTTVCVIGTLVAASYFYCPYVKEQFGKQIEEAGKTMSTIDQKEIDKLLDKKVTLPTVEESSEAFENFRNRIEGGEK